MDNRSKKNRSIKNKTIIAMAAMGVCSSLIVSAGFYLYSENSFSGTVSILIIVILFIIAIVIISGQLTKVLARPMSHP